jgi:hypothetical protein
VGVIEHPFLPKIGREKIMGNSAGSWKPPCSSLYPFLDQAADHPITAQDSLLLRNFRVAGNAGKSSRRAHRSQAHFDDP